MSKTPTTRKRYLQITPPSDDNKIKFIFATESPVEYPTFNEILICEPEFVDLVRFKKDAMSLLFNHDWNDLIGTITKIWFEDLNGAKRLCGEALLNPEGKHFSDIKAGILKSISVGYEPVKVIRKGKGKNGKEDFYFSWNPHEISLVTVPADPDSKIIRRKVAAITTPQPKKVEVEVKAAVKTESRAAPSTASQPASQPATFRNLHSMKNPMTLDEINTALELGDKFKCADLVKRALRDNKDLTEIRAAILAEMASKPVPQFDAKETKEIKKRYSILRALRSQIAQYGRGEDAGYEIEVSQEIGRRNGGKTPAGIYIPTCVISKRDFSVAGTSGATVATTIADLVEPVYANSVLDKLGVQTLNGLTDTISLPKMTSATTYWIASEGGSVTESTPGLSNVTASPKTLGVRTEITRKMLTMSSVAADAIVESDFSKLISSEVCNAYFNATGLSGSPVGLAKMFTDNSITAVTVTQDAPTYKQIMNFEAAILDANMNGDNLKWAVDPEVYALLSTTPRSAGGNGFIIENGLLAGRPVIVTSHADGAILGDFSSSIVCSWGLGVDVRAQNVIENGGVMVAAMSDWDFLFRHPQAFSYAKNSSFLS